MPDWTIHDLRRTARSLMSRAGVRPDIAERAMGHAITGVEGFYDRHTYTDEKADALARLAGQIEQIINPAPANVVTLKPRPRSCSIASFMRARLTWRGSDRLVRP
jgi:hypothetical protein